VSACLAEEYEAGTSAAALARKYNLHKPTALQPVRVMFV
jgi:hypothetical protein